MAKKFRIFAAVGAGRLFFDGSRVPPAPLGGKILASINPNFSDRVRMVRTDLFAKDGVTPRRVFKGLKAGRIKNEAGQVLINEGFTVQQIVDYINDQANKKANEIDFKLDGTIVGGGTTIDFVGGGVTGLTVANDIVTVSVSSTVSSSNIVGLITTGQIQSLDASQLSGVVGTGNLPITSLGGVNFVPGESDATPAFNLEDAHSLPYSALTGVPTHETTINEFEYYQQYLTPGAGFSTEGPGITTTNPPEQNNPFYYGTQLKPYQEMVWTHSMQGVGAYWVGKWNGNTSYTPTTAGNVANWERVLVFRNSNDDGHHIDYAGGSLDSQGFGFVGGGTGIFTNINNNTSFIRLRYNGDNNKLELYRGSNTPIGIATANLAEDGNPITISFAISDNANVHLPGITTVQYYVDQTKWKFHNSNKALENSTHDADKGVVYWGEPLHRGEELIISTPGNSYHVGVWNGGTGLVGIDTIRNKANWTTKWQYNHNRTDWEAATATHGPTGVELAKDIQVDNGTYAIRRDHTTNKLQLWEVSTSHDWLLSNANSTVGITTQHIYFSKGGAGTGGDSLPTVTHRSQDFTLTSFTDSDRPGPSFYDGTKVNDVWKSNRSFKNGLKLKFTVPTTAGNQYWATAFEGTEDLGNGENNPYQAGEMTWRLTNQEKFNAHEDCTLNTNYTAIDGSNTLSLSGRDCSWRYNSDNTWDIFDEETDEVILTGDDVLSGNVYPYLLAVNNSDDVLSDYVQYEWEWNKAAWFMEYRDWGSGHNANTYLSISANGRALMEAADFLSTFSNGFYYLGTELYKATWGQKMRPGQEYVFTMPTINQHGATKNNMKIGVLDSTYRQFTAAINFNRFGQPKEQSDQDLGFTLAAGISTATECAGTSMRMKYEFGTNKLVCESVSGSVRTKIGESTSALDGNPIFITLGGDSTRLPVATGVEVYGWETAHQPVNYYNPWENWRIGGFPENSGVTVGIATTGQVLAHKADQVWRHKDGLASGYKMHWQLPNTATNTRFGVWKSGNAASGLTNVENNPGLWEWGFRLNTSEEILDLDGMTFNTSNSNYSATKWTDPNPGSTKFSIRYHANNSLDIFDESNGEIIATKDADCDGNPLFISSGPGGAINNNQQLIDDFFSGGDVGIALTTTAV